MHPRGPDFLCIGAQKAGTTWLHENLIQHPGVFLPPVKELHFLDHGSPSLSKRLFGKASHHRLAREHLRDVLLRRSPVDNNLALAWRIALGHRDWDWYERLFACAGTRIAGEICPGYARLDEARIAGIAARYPRLKVIYLLRDPVDRAWSSVAMHFRKSGNGLVTREESHEILAQLRKPKSFGHCTYQRNIEAWSLHFPSDRMYFGFFDRIRNEPEAYLREILGFLGIAGSFRPRDASEPVNKGKGERIEPALEREIAGLLLPEAEFLNRKFANPHTARWLDHAMRAAA
jgi:hypothetical protein